MGLQAVDINGVASLVLAQLEKKAERCEERSQVAANLGNGSAMEAQAIQAELWREAMKAVADKGAALMMGAGA